ncbi:CinA family protein [Chryseobacterium viscerum]|uniref:CinA family protein n=1 Tax=Chryseobacterium viscerum TaxID=1037377 RepID=A0A316WQS8_9FLAO|nr:CinA family protein [Chryseobacterium viscerum]KAB1231608.1 CinA family protein [Chryseobacterium viscerum]PWN60890.1 damage-inducible protein CinA [Chryseobacterium viscerum]
MKFQQDLLDYISTSLVTIGETVSIAESVTSGLLQLAFSQMPNSSLFYKGGITTFTLPEKRRFLDSNCIEEQENDFETQRMADIMAVKVASSFGTDWGISSTGYAKSARNSGFHVFSFCSFSYKGEIILSKRIDLDDKSKALDAQLYYTEFILGCFKGALNQILI